MVATPQGQEWVLQSAGAEYGPYSLDELKLILRSGKLVGEKFVWKRGLVNWLRVEDHDDLAKKLPLALKQGANFVIERGTNYRKSVRSTLIATVAISTKEGKFIGICFDLSQTGLQVTDLRATLQVNEVYDILIIPLTATGVQHFSATARVAWFDGAKQSAGFEFRDEIVKASVVNYLKARQKHY